MAASSPGVGAKRLYGQNARIFGRRWRQGACESLPDAGRGTHAQRNRKTRKIKGLNLFDDGSRTAFYMPIGSVSYMVKSTRGG